MNPLKSFFFSFAGPLTDQTNLDKLQSPLCSCVLGPRLFCLPVYTNILTQVYFDINNPLIYLHQQLENCTVRKPRKFHGSWLLSLILHGGSLHCAAEK